MAIQPVYRAQWQSLPLSLRPIQLTTAQKARQIAWNILSVIIPIIGLCRLAAYGIGVLARRAILPAAYFHTKEDKAAVKNWFNYLCRRFSPHFEVTPHTIVTPDGAALSVHLFRSRNGNAQTPTTLFFTGNFGLKGSGSWEWVLQDSITKNRPMNLVLFDYRSVDESTGTFTGAKDLLIDSASIAQWVKDSIRTPSDQIHFYGISLGAAIALKAKAADERLTGDLLHERSFSSLEDWLKWAKTRVNCFLRPLVPLAIYLLKNQGLELDAASDLPKLRGRKLVVYHPNDPVIPYPASLARKAPADSFELIEEDEGFDTNHHGEPLAFYRGAQERASQFLFNG